METSSDRSAWRKVILPALAVIVVLVMVVGLGGRAVAKKFGLAARKSDKTRPDTLHPVDAIPIESTPASAGYENATEVSVEFGTTTTESGLYVVEVGDSKHVPAMVDGEPTRFFKGGVELRILLH